MFQDLWGQWGKFSLSWCKSDVYNLKLIKVKRGTVKSNENIFGLCSMPPMPGMPPRPNYMQNGPPVSMPGSNPMSTQSGPSKPLFPSAQVRVFFLTKKKMHVYYIVKTNIICIDVMIYSNFHYLRTAGYTCRNNIFLLMLYI